MLVHLIGAQLVERVAVVEGFAGGLHGKVRLGPAELEQLAVAAHDRNRELIRVHLRKRGDIRRLLTVLVLLGRIEELGDPAREPGEIRDGEIADQHPFDERSCGVNDVQERREVDLLGLYGVDPGKKLVQARVLPTQTVSPQLRQKFSLADQTVPVVVQRREQPGLDGMHPGQVAAGQLGRLLAHPSSPRCAQTHHVSYCGRSSYRFVPRRQGLRRFREPTRRLSSSGNGPAWLRGGLPRTRRAQRNAPWQGCRQIACAGSSGQRCGCPARGRAEAWPCGS